MTYSFKIMAACLAILHTSAAAAQNAWDPWLDLINFQPMASGLISKRDARGHTQKTYDIQRIQDGEGAALNVDEYVVQISTLPHGWSETEFFAHVRKNLNSFLDQKVAILGPYTTGDGKDWNTGTDAQPGTLMVFEIHITGPNDMAAVVVSRTDSLSWIFSPVTDGLSEVTSDWGTHPVAGNRLFGLRQAMGNYEFLHEALTASTPRM